MGLVILVFVAVLAVIVGAYMLLVVQPERQQRASVLKRMLPSNRQREVRRQLVKAMDDPSLAAIEEQLKRWKRVVGPVQNMLDQSGVNMTLATLFLLCLFCAALAFFVVFVATHWLILGAAAASLAAWLPFLHVKHKRKVRIRQFEEQFPEAIDLIARALRAGHAFPSGLSMVAEEMAPPVGPEFQVLYDQQNYGMPLPEALRSFASRIPLLDAKFFVTAVLTQREAGGNLAEVLDNLASVIRDRFKVKRQVRVISAHGRITGWVLAGLPPALAAMLTLIAPKHMGELFYTSLGHWMLLAALALQILGSLIIRKLVQIEY